MKKPTLQDAWWRNLTEQERERWRASYNALPLAQIARHIDLTERLKRRTVKRPLKLTSD